MYRGWIGTGVVVGALVGVLAAGCGLSWGELTPTEDEVEPFDHEALNFLVVGDWGRNGRFRQDRVSEQMARTADEIAADFVISTGDNFYEHGVTSIEDPQWLRSYEWIYTAPSLEIPWYVVLGNHDYEGSVVAQIRYTEVSERWTMPARYYAIEAPVDDTTEALFLFLDTAELISIDSLAPDPNAAIEWRPSRQYGWIDSVLAVSDAEWRIAVGHYPIYSASAKHRDSPVLRRKLAPILRRHGVQAYIAGHVHSLQHLDPAGTGVEHFVSGGGSLARKVDPDTAVVFAAGVSGFMAASLTPEAMQVRFVDYRGTVGHVARVPREEKDAAPRTPPSGARTTD